MPVLLSLLTFIFALLPFTLGPSSPFFTLDQEIVYVTNALSYVVRKQIPFYDHPGTPHIVGLAAAYTPLRLWAKYVVHTPFIDWSIQNFTFLNYYSRVFALAVYGLGLTIFLSAVYRFTQSRLTVLLSWLCLFAYSEFLRNGVRTVPENYLMLSTAIWIWLFLWLVQKPILIRFLVLSVAGGLALATKFNSLTIVLITWIHAGLFLTRRRWRLWLVIVGMTVMGFVISTWPIRSHYISMFNWTYSLASHLEPSGSGKQDWFDLEVTRTSLKTMLQQEPYLLPFFFMTPVIYLVSLRRLSPNLRLAFGVAIIFIEIFFFIYAKYPRPHYQLLHFLVLSAITAVLLNRSKILVLLFIVLLTPLMIYRVRTHAAWSKNLGYLAKFEQFISSHPPRYRTLWLISNTRDFSLLWGRGWSGEFYGSQLDRYYPKIGEMVGFDTYRDNAARTYPLFSVCWDQLYLRASELNQFLAAYPERQFQVTGIENTKYYLITTDHCKDL